jgi:hypothetical protein
MCFQLLPTEGRSPMMNDSEADYPTVAMSFCGCMVIADFF